MADLFDLPRPATVKALTLWQPYATLVAGSVKCVETRGWGTRYRGPLAVHAARKWDRDVWEGIEEARAALKRCWGLGEFLAPACQRALYETPWRDTLGCVVALVDLVGCRPMLEAPDVQEALFGHYGPGRWGWVFDPATIRPLPEPVAVKGNRMLWDLPPGVLAAVEAQLASAKAR